MPVYNESATIRQIVSKVIAVPLDIELIIVDDASTDDRRTFIQVVPTKFQLNGVAQLAKGYEESYLKATAGVMVKRPYAVYRVTGI